MEPETSNALFCQGMTCIRALPDAREQAISVPHSDLKGLIHVVHSYLQSAKKKTPPSKALLRKAVLALMQEGTVLSRQWDKTQLALIVLKWAHTALKLALPEEQPNLFVQVRVSDDNPKVLAHKCCLRDELSEEVVSFSIASPSPVKTTPLAAPSEEPLPDGGMRSSAEFSSPAFDNNFLQEIDDLAKQADLAAIPVLFYTPRVSNSQNSDDKSPGEPVGPDPGFASFDTSFHDEKRPNYPLSHR